MIARVGAALRKLRRGLSRSHWSARLLGSTGAEVAPGEPGLLLVQIDGLGRGVLERALGEGRMPFLARLRDREGHRLHPLYSGVPSTTPVMQGEFFYGVRTAVPAFSFVDRDSGQVVFMYERDAARRVEERLSREPGLLQGGSAYCDVYTGGAADARFCMASLGWGDFFRAAHPLSLPLLAVVHAPVLLRAGGRLLLELGRALWGLEGAVRGGEHLPSELKFVTARLTVGVVLTEMVVLGAEVDLARGLPTVHVNLLGYDEHAHRRGPSAADAMAQLREADRAIARLARAARRSARRHYDVWVYSDHGQEPTRAYPEHHEQSLEQAVAGVFRDEGVFVDVPSPASGPGAGTGRGVQGQRARLLSERLLRFVAPGMAAPAPLREPGSLAIAAQGPLGHVYAPRPLTSGERDRIARGLVRDAEIPLVLAAEPGGAAAWNEQGRFRLPEDVAALLGPEHPYPAWVAEDLVAVAHHRDAGDLVISGFRPGGPHWSFPHEAGAHGGPGPNETDVFALLPPDTPVPDTGALRPLDLRHAALDVLGRGGAPRSWASPRSSRAPRSLRIVTYNVHSCRGLDGHVSPERIARLLARLDPDVIALQELDVARARTGGVDQAQAIAVALEMELHFLTTVLVEEERFGNAVLSRLPMRLVKAAALPALERSRPLEPRGALWVEVETSGTRLQVIGTHLSLNRHERGLQVEALLGPEWLAHPYCASPRIFCGDLNALPFFPVCQRLGKVLRDCQSGRGVPQPTFAAPFPMGRIDHVFVEPSLEVQATEVPRNQLSLVASDHLPLVVDVAIP